ncbi:hypothetical protein EsDP_00006707 [Epichloe bromicola]|uniref:DOMON domain-containing protein n=1 Tax=Epichloe bromicola TaxID=79588 RepID=A0ABQ0CYU6_9HYPO
MRFQSSKGAIVAATAILNVATAQAAPTSYCSVDNQVCFQWGVPEAVANSGSGNVYFQLRAPTSYAWVGLGIGSRMQGSDMFVMYENGNGNVTLSTRQGLNHVMPTYRQKKGVELLAGSGVVDGHMVANVRCSDCSMLSLRDTNGWLSAWKKGSSLASTSPSAQIAYHDGHDQFSVDFTKAAVSSDSNPFVSSRGGNASGGNGSGSGSNPGAGSGSESGSSSPGAGVVKTSDPNRDIIHAHGIMSIVFLIGYPVGSMVMPLLGKWLLHASWQMVMFLLMWAGFGVGYVLSRRLDLFFMQAHTRLGVILCCLVSLQPVLGWLHHQHYVKHQRRGAVSHAHIWYGRALIILGMVNGGLGLQLAGMDRPFVIAYCTIAGVFAALYVGSVILGAVKGRSSRGEPK